MAFVHRDTANPFSHRPNAAWAIFDAALYAASNPAAHHLTEEAALLDHYLAHGAAAGFSPNRWFDETFYRRTNPSVAELIRTGELASGFDHYCTTGYPHQAPHWLFDPTVYLANNPTLTADILAAAGFVNAYDHFLKHGAAEQRVCHPFFDCSLYASALSAEDAAACAATGAYVHFLTRSWNPRAPGQAEPSVSGRFDPSWYLSAYPHVAEEIRDGLWHSALHHYLLNRDNDSFQPLPPCPGARQAEPARGAPAGRIKIHVDRPAHGNGEAVEPIEGHLDIIGWAAADHPVAAVDVYIDGTHCGRAHHGIRTEGVAATYPDLSHAMFAGFRFVWPAPQDPGRHVVRIVARGETGLEATEEFVAAFKPALLQDGPWSLRRRMPSSEAALKTRILHSSGQTPSFIIIFPDGDQDAQARERTLTSLDRQVYKNWRLNSTSSSLARNDLAAPDCWLVPLTPGDDLGVDALLELALHRLAQPDADFLYSDERRIDPALDGIAPFFKPDWSPDLLLSTDYIGRLWAASATLVAEAGLTIGELAVKTNHDLVLRLTERAKAIAHIPHVLCESAPRQTDKISVQHALARRCIDAEVETGRAPETWRITYLPPRTASVTVIIPTAGVRGLIETALHSLRQRTAYAFLEVIVIDTVPGIKAPWKAAMHKLADRVIEDAAPFSWSRLNNQAAAHATGELLLFLNDDVALPEYHPDANWLHKLAGPMQDAGVGVVGPQLLYPGGVVQHAGMFLTGGGGRNAFVGLPGTAPGSFGLALTQRNVSAVTGACMLVRRAVFHQLGGFDERLDIACNDTDFCLRSLQAGFRVVYTPHATLTHHESVSRTGLPEADNENLFREFWRQHLSAGDPYFNKHLSAAHTDYRPDPECTEIIYPSRPLAAAETIQRILVIKLDQIGDFLLSKPALHHIRQAFADAEITLLAAPEICALAASDPAIDRTIAFDFALPQQGNLPDAPAWQAMAAALRARNFDLAIDLRCHTESRPVLRETGATWRAGFDPDGEFPWLDIVSVMEADTARRAKRTHMADTLLDFARKIAACFTSVAPVPAASPGAWPPAVPAPPDGALRIAIHAGAGTAIKRWPAARFAELIDSLAGMHACWIVLVGAESEAELGNTILASVRHAAVVSAVGLTTLQELAAVLGGCDLFIGNDSGPKHLAASLGVRTVGIHSGVVDTREWSPMGPSAISIRRRTYCSPCYLATENDCPRSRACLTEVAHRNVLDIVSMLTAERRRVP